MKQRLAYNSNNGSYSRSDVWGMHFFNMNTGITCGGNGLMKTTNGGLTFDSIPGTYINSRGTIYTFLITAQDIRLV
jgi:hypothetical protein